MNANMKFGLRRLLIATALTSILYGCGGSSSESTPSGLNIHLAGNSALLSAQAVYWNPSLGNPEPLLLQSDGASTFVLDMEVSNHNTVYIVGSSRAEGVTRPVLWVDNQLQYLPLGPLASESADSIATTVAVTDGTVHIAGGVAMAATGSPLPAYWINSELQDFLPVPDLMQGGLVNSMTMAENAVYHAGFVVTGSMPATATVAYWKNGVRTDLVTPARVDSDYSDAIGLAIAVDGNDVYVLGGIQYYINTNNELPQSMLDYLMLDPDCYGAWLQKLIHAECPLFECQWRSGLHALGIDGTTASRGVVWKNGQPMPVEPIIDGQTMWPTGLAVVNGRIWVVGYRVADDNTAKPYYWVDNGQGGFVATPLSMLRYELNGMAFTITPHESNVYIGGFTSIIRDADTIPPTLREVAAYWVNGDRVDLEPGMAADDSPDRWVTTMRVVTSPSIPGGWIW